MHLMKTHRSEKVLWTCGRLLKVLSACPSNKREIVRVSKRLELAS